MVAPELMRCALTVDFTSECTSFLREQFDVDDVDAACNFSAFHAFRRRMQRLFCDGYILGSAPSLPPQRSEGEPPDQRAPKSIAQIVFEQIQTPEPTLSLAGQVFLVLLAGKRLLRVWDQPAAVPGATKDLVWQQGALHLHPSFCCRHSWHHGPAFRCDPSNASPA